MTEKGSNTSQPRGLCAFLFHGNPFRVLFMRSWSWEIDSMWGWAGKEQRSKAANLTFHCSFWCAHNPTLPFIAMCEVTLIGWWVGQSFQLFDGMWSITVTSSFPIMVTRFSLKSSLYLFDLINSSQNSQSLEALVWAEKRGITLVYEVRWEYSWEL